MTNLYEILVPTQFEDTKRPVRTKHHKEFDKYAYSLSGGLTIMKPCRGKWVHQSKLYEDRVIPVRIACTAEQIKKIARFAKKHYRQLSIMYYTLSNEVHYEV